LFLAAKIVSKADSLVLSYRMGAGARRSAGADLEFCVSPIGWSAMKPKYRHRT